MTDSLFPPAPPPLDRLDIQIDELNRELKMRQRVYPRMLQGPRPPFTPARAEKQIADLRAAINTLQALYLAPSNMTVGQLRESLKTAKLEG